MSGGIRIGSIFGIPVYLHYTWFAVFALVTVNLTIVIGAENLYPEWSVARRASVAAVTALLFFASVLLHELSHSVVAIRNRIPVHSITLYIFGGVARITKEAPSAKVEAAVAIAGPLMSVLLAVVFGVIAYTVGRANDYVQIGAFWLALINGMVAAFNMLPGFPMDGGRVLRAILWGRTKNLLRATRWASRVGRAMGFLLMFLGGLQVLLTQNVSGLWLVFIGWFIENAASSSYRQMVLQEALDGVTARQMMMPDAPSVADHVTVDLLVNGYLIPSGRRCFMVMGCDRLVGLVTATDVSKVPTDKWTTTRVHEVMTPWERVVRAEPATPATVIMASMVERNLNQIPITANGAVIGLVTRERLLETMRARAEMRG